MPIINWFQSEPQPKQNPNKFTIICSMLLFPITDSTALGVNHLQSSACNSYLMNINNRKTSAKGYYIFNCLACHEHLFHSHIQSGPNDKK